jgi:hypothetical protein
VTVVAPMTASTSAIATRTTKGVGGLVLLRQRRVIHGVHGWRAVHDGDDINCGGPRLQPHEGNGKVDRSGGAYRSARVDNVEGKVDRRVGSCRLQRR